MLGLRISCLLSLFLLPWPGIQGQLWSETVRTSEQLDEMIFPRMIGLAERAWHKAAWEDLEDREELDAERRLDWERFANILGYHQLARVDGIDIAYNVRQPGAEWVYAICF